MGPSLNSGIMTRESFLGEPLLYLVAEGSVNDSTLFIGTDIDY